MLWPAKEPYGWSAEFCLLLWAPTSNKRRSQCAEIVTACAPGDQHAETAIFSLRGSASGAFSMLCSVSSLAAIASLRLS